MLDVLQDRRLIGIERDFGGNFGNRSPRRNRTLQRKIEDFVDPALLLKVTQGEITFRSAKPLCFIAALRSGTNCCLSPEKL